MKTVIDHDLPIHKLITQPKSTFPLFRTLLIGPIMMISSTPFIALIMASIEYSIILIHRYGNPLLSDLLSMLLFLAINHIVCFFIGRYYANHRGRGFS